MRKRQAAAHRDEIEATIERALFPGDLIRYGQAWDFVSGLEEVAAKIAAVIDSDPARAARLYESFLAGCYAKAEEIDDSSGSFGMFVETLFSEWVKARQAAGADPDETAQWLLGRMDDDPYGFAYHLERSVVKVMDERALAAFASQVRIRFSGGEPREPAVSGKERDADDARSRWGNVLRAIYAAQNDLDAYVALCEETHLTAADCVTIATMFRCKQPEKALDWVNRGLALDKKQPGGSMAGHDLSGIKRELLTKLGRGADALEDAWAEFRDRPDTYTYRELMRFVAKADRTEWHGKAMDAAANADLPSLIELWLETKEIDRLVGRLRKTTDADLEALSHYTTEPVAKRIVKSHPDVAARLFQAMGMRILNAKKSRYYDAAIENFEHARTAYERAGLGHSWEKVVATVRDVHRRKIGFMGAFERVVAGQGPRSEPSFLDRAKSRFPPPRSS